MMKISKSLLFCLVVCCGLYGLSDGATLPSVFNDTVTEVGSTTWTLLSKVDDILNCNSSDSNYLPSPSEIAAHPIKSLSNCICYTLKTIRNGGKAATDVFNHPLETVLPPIMAVLKNFSDSNIVPDPLNSLLHTIISLYDINRLLMSAL
ncbi:PREDICTED: uncharacterized protein LOC106792353 [Polistes canadensis]|uniref:uncharacterized protein LOC106792353 n=1 Tax=Polistes canadensis TaxID=91411 RepID=UPI000718F682|nr:PREDICTED: uncharacterized protein LOC106792353 [Polistes canadensis]